MLSSIVRPGSEGSPNPWWDDPSKENDNLQLSMKEVHKVLGDDPNFLFFITSSTTRSSVCYFWNPATGKVQVRWLLIDPIERQIRAKELKTEDTGQPLYRPLKPYEIPAYAVEELPNNCFKLKSFEQAKRSDLLLQIVSSNNTVACIVNLRNNETGTLVPVRLDCAYVQCCKGIIPNTDFIHIYATDITTHAQMIDTLTRK